MRRFENWSVQVYLGQYRPPLLISSSLYLCGNVYGHEHIPNGRRIKSSKVVELDIKDRIARTTDSVYRLGRPDKWYLEWLKRNNFSLRDFGLG